MMASTLKMASTVYEREISISDNNTRHHSGQNPQQILTTVTTRIVVDKSTDHSKPHSIYFVHTKA